MFVYPQHTVRKSRDATSLITTVALPLLVNEVCPRILLCNA